MKHVVGACLIMPDTEKLVHVFINLKLDWSECPVVSINQLQLDQNATPKILIRSKKNCQSYHFIFMLLPVTVGLASLIKYCDFLLNGMSSKSRLSFPNPTS